MTDLYRNILKRLDNMTIKINTIEYNVENNTADLRDYYNKDYINNCFNNVNNRIEHIYLNASNVINGNLNELINNLVQEVQFLRGLHIEDINIKIGFRSVGSSNILYNDKIIIKSSYILGNYNNTYNISDNSLFPTDLGNGYYLQYPFNYNIEENNGSYEIILLGDNSGKYIYQNNNVSISNRNVSNIPYYDLPLLAYNGKEISSLNSLFESCMFLTSLDLSNFNTTNVNNMSSMFSGCISLTSLDLSDFNTTNVNDTNNMFSYCDSLTNLDLSNFNTTNVNDMSSMFSGCSSLTSLDLSSFDTTNVTNMRSMFYYCDSLTSLDLSNFNTTNVNDIQYMFYNCTSLTNISININCSNISGILTQGTGKSITNWPDTFEQNKVYMLVLQ